MSPETDPGVVELQLEAAPLTFQLTVPVGAGLPVLPITWAV